MAKKAAGRSRKWQKPGLRENIAKSSAAPAKNVDTALIRKMMSSECSESRHLLVPDLIYKLSDELCQLAYGSGFDLGVEAYEDSDRTLDALARLLANAGLGRTTFQMSEYRGIVTSYGVKPNAADLGTNMHDFEAGVIAGYLSAHSRRRIAVTETKCACNGSGFCQFVASPSERAAERTGKPLALEDLVRLADRSMRSYDGPATSKPYYFLLSRPLTLEPVLTHASRLAYLIGKGLAESEPQSDFERGVMRISRHLGIEKARVVSARGKGRAIELTYGHYCSSGGFVDLTTAMLAGFSKGVFNKNIYVQRRLSGKTNYVVRLSLRAVPANRERVQ